MKVRTFSPFVLPVRCLVVSGGLPKPSAVTNWAIKKNPVPIIRCVEIEELTGGMVTRKQLRPDDWHLIWPELRGRD